ncbi:MAG: hypothetical protein HC897_06520 [Thermoanaerobaculia bacterium]|nr:hypothetical protein [Thermoanaerobaculia bacterium]
MDALKPYPSYKEAGVDWLGRVPAHWEVRKLKNTVSFLGGGTPSKANTAFWNGTIPWVSPKDMRGPWISSATDYITQEAVWGSATSVIPPHAVILVVRSGILRRTIPVAINIVEVALNQDMKALRPKRDLIVGEYLRALIQGNETALIAEWTKQGATVESIEHEFLANSRIPLPPLFEQRFIARFLDHADRRIRRYIRAKRRLIALLNEQKQAIIHGAVTRGLDPNVRLKPSGVEWLGDVPEHWEVVRLKVIATHIVDCLHATPVYSNEGEYPAIRTADVQAGQLLLATARRVSEEQYRAWTARMPPTAGDILYTREGERFGLAALVPPGVQLCISQRMMAFRIHERQVSAYFMWQINCQHVYAQAAADLIGAAAPHVNVSRIRNFWLAKPPKPEQAQIVAMIERAITQPDTLISKARGEITLLQEYRTRLIADVVTGKLDVREAAAKLPEESDEEPENLEDSTDEEISESEEESEDSDEN